MTTDLETVGAMHQCKKGELYSTCIHCGATAEKLNAACPSFMRQAARCMEAAQSPTPQPSPTPQADSQPAPTHAQIAAYLEATGAYVTNDATRKAAIAEAVNADRAARAPADSQPTKENLCLLDEFEKVLDALRDWNNLDDLVWIQYREQILRPAIAQARIEARAPADSVTAPAGPTDAQIDACARSMLYQPWGIGSRIEDARAFARRILSKFTPPSQAADSGPLKDHQIAALVNELRDIAVKFHATQQLRERISRVVVPALRVGAESVTAPAGNVVRPSKHKETE